MHFEVCDIDYKLHAIIASRKRSVIQSIQEETATNIYYPTPLVGVLDPPLPGQSSVGYRSLGMGPLSVQSNGNVSMQMAGNIQGMNGMNQMGGMGGMNGVSMPMGNHMGIGMGNMNGGAYGHGPPQQHQQQQHHQHNRNQSPIYNPHQHVHYPYQPQPLDINPQTTRGMPYTGPGINHYSPGPAPMNGMGMGGMGHHGPMSVNHTGMSGMTHMSNAATGYQSRGMTSPMPMAMSPNPTMHQTHQSHQPHQPHLGHGMGHHHNHNNGPHAHHQGHMMNGNHHGNQQMSGHAGGNMGMGMNNPYQGQTHMHVGLGGGHMSIQGGMGMGMGGGMAPGMGMQGAVGGMGQYGSGPHPGLSVHSGEQGSLGKANQVWITGEFFGVQRARDMLLNVAVQKVRDESALSDRNAGFGKGQWELIDRASWSSRVIRQSFLASWIGCSQNESKSSKQS